MANRPLVGVGVLIFKGRNVLVGKRLGSHGAGQYALPGGHLEYGESLEECACREVMEETGIALRTPSLAYTTSSVFHDIEKHYVTVFMREDVGEEVEAQLLEPNKCEGWMWVPWSDIPRPLFPPLQALLDSSYQPFGKEQQSQ